MENEMTCQELVELVSDYLEGALPPSERERFEQHLSVCPGCTRYLAQMRRSIEMMGKLTEASIEPAERDELLELFRNWKKGTENG